MSSLSVLPLNNLLCFLRLADRIHLALCSKSLYDAVKPFLNPLFDKELTYQSFKSSLLPKKKSKIKPLPIIQHKSLTYQELEIPIFKLRKELKSINYDFEITENGFSTFSNKFGDKLIVHSSLIEPPEVNDGNYEFLANANDLNEDIDFSNPMMLIKRQKMLLEKVNKNKEEILSKQKLAAMKHIRNWGFTVIILCHGGNFNIASFNPDGHLEKSNSDHKYVSRKQQGGRQANKDKSKGGIHSMGANIRRENEKKHSENIESIVSASYQALDRASLIFLHAPGLNYYTFVGEHGHLQRWKDKIRSVGVTTGKAKLQEAERVFAEISTCRVLFRV